MSNLDLDLAFSGEEYAGAFSFEDSDLVPTVRTLRLFEGSSRAFGAKIGNQEEVPARVTLLSGGRLNRLSWLDQTNEFSEGGAKHYNIASGVISGVRMEITVDGKDISEVVTDIINRDRQKNEQRILSVEETLLALSDAGIHLHGEMALFIQQMGANPAKWEPVRNHFKSVGAVDVKNSIPDPGRITEAWGLSKGIPVLGFDLRSADRSRSATGQGFVDLADAIIHNVMRVIMLKKMARVLRKQVKAAVASGTQSDEDLKVLQGRLAHLERQGSNYAGTWGGAQKQIDVVRAQQADVEAAKKADPESKLKVGDVLKVKDHDPLTYQVIQIPCGHILLDLDYDESTMSDLESDTYRYTVEGEDEPRERDVVAYDFWMPGLGDAPSAAVSTDIDELLEGVEEDEDEDGLF